MLVVSQRVPNIRQFEDESLHRTFARKRVDANQLLGITAGAVDRYGAFVRLNQPSKRGTVRDPFLHLLANSSRTVAGRSQFNDEVGTEMPEAFSLGRIQLLDAGLQRPRRIGRTARSVGQNEACRRVAHHATAITFCPRFQLKTNLRIPKPGYRERSGHYDEFSLRSHLKEQIRMFRAQGSKLGIRHRMGCEDGGQMFLINCERHGFSVTLCSSVRKGYRTRIEPWLLNDDIAVLPTRRTR